ncbi:helix-turn-helix domain-containing protein [Gloeocapsa sp. PCC 73106]|uniref:helix-turn-helix domain-containing protein n=1 Tax=Gloeocapsa sp. PCC 73106 TaxID=102232 RepID=UPI0002E2B643|nr:helix-turn-helix domain-containing protein [Gloeocapsa sp. PCC 73106]
MVGVCGLKIKEAKSELREILSTQKNAVDYKKIQALYLMKTGQADTVTTVSELLGVHRVTVQKWFKKYREQGIDGLLTSKKSTGRPSIVSQSTLLELEEKLNRASGCFKSYEDVHAWLQEKHGVDANYKTIYGLLRYKLKVNLKADQINPLVQEA